MSMDPNVANLPTIATARPGRTFVDWLLVGALVLAIGGIAFAVGRSTAPATAAGTFPGALPNGGFVTGPAASLAPGASAAPGAGGVPGGGPAGGAGFLGVGGLAVDGTVTAIDGASLTLTLDSGESMTFTLDEATTYHEATSAAADAVAVGDDVSVRLAGGRVPLGNGGADGGGTPSLTASDVTVTR